MRLERLASLSFGYRVSERAAAPGFFVRCLTGTVHSSLSEVSMTGFTSMGERFDPPCVQNEYG